MIVLEKILEALSFSFGMFWEILWALILGFLISAIIQALVSKQKMAQFLPNDSPISIAKATAFGAASSSCSYAAVAIARSIFRKGANFTSAIAFQFASTNLVIEMGIILFVLLGWQFVLAEFIGGPAMIIILVFLFRNFLKKELIEEARDQANKGIPGAMEDHASMDMSQAEGSILKRLKSQKGITAISHYFIMDWLAIWKDIVLGLLIAGTLAALVPHSFWQSFFIQDNEVFAKIWGPIIGPIVAIISFVCSIGNIPLAAVLWAGGISFGGVISFIFADLIVLPILNIYRKYYGVKMSVFLLITSYIAMVLAGYFTEILFGILKIIPLGKPAIVASAEIQLNYTTILNLIFLLVSIFLLVQYYKTSKNDKMGVKHH